MKTKSNRTFIILALAMLITGIIGVSLVVVLVKAQVDSRVRPTLIVGPNIVTINPTIRALLQQTETAEIALTLTQTATLSVLPRETTSTVTAPAAAVSSSCAWAWAQQDLPDLTTAAQQALDDAGVADSTVRVEAYGENCLDSTGKVGNFAAMTTDFYVTTKVSDLSDETVVALAVAIYNALLHVPTSIMPARPGYLDITMNAATDSKHLRAMFPSIRAALQQGLTGKALIAIFSH